jgi:hypothetical protein
MGQKLPLNNVPSIFTVPKTPGSRIFHKLKDNPPNIWDLHLWIATNDVPGAASATVVVGASTPGGPPVALITQTLFGIGSTSRVVKIADGIPLRGPLDLSISYTGGDAAPTLPMAAIGYISRGDTTSKEERRFFDPGANIGDQETNFTGGKAVLLTGISTPQAIHQVSEDYIDEITLDVQSIAGSVLTSVQFDTALSGVASETPIEVELLGIPVRVFDGVPFRDAGLLQCAVDPLEAAVFFWTGYFIRG